MHRVLPLLAAALLTPLAVANPETPAPPTPAAAPEPAPLRGLAKLQADAAILTPLVQTDLARDFLRAVETVPPPALSAERTIYIHQQTRRPITETQYDALPEADREPYRAQTLSEDFYYSTRYGSPLAYVRSLDVLAATDAGRAFRSLAGKRIMDFGYGAIGHLRVAASMGADVVGVEVDPTLRVLYSDPGDTGSVGKGRLTLVHGRWPGTSDQRAVRDAAGGGFDLITSKNTLKNGYINPEREVDPRFLVDLGVPKGEFLAALHDSLKPGGVVVIYNISGPRSKPDERYLPQTDGRSPFTREELEAAGFAVLAFDAGDDENTLAMAKALGWEAHMSLEGLNALYTIFQRRQ